MIKTRWAVKACSLALCLCLAGCSTAPDIPQPTLDELLAEVNAEHQSIQRGELDPTPYLRTSLSKEDWPKAAEYATATYSDYDPDKLLTHDEAVEDVNYLFDACYYAYGLYDYFGGHETFDAARQAILHDLDGKDSMTCQQLEEIMVSHLGFIKDGHFSINQNHPAPFQIPFFFRQTAFLKTGDGYQTTNGKVVESVENHEDLDELFKRSISKQGQLVYYPVLLKEAAFDGESEFQKHTCDEKLVIHYTDGSTETLTAEPWKLYFQNLPKGQNTELRETDGIPVFQFNNFSTEYEHELLDGADQLKDAPVSMLDLRSNMGGNTDTGYAWFRRYVGYRGYNVPCNGSFFRPDSVIPMSLPDGWIEHENVLVLLLGKASASASEAMTDIICNLENALIIGENSWGALLGSAEYMELPNSKCGVRMGMNNIYLTAEDEPFEEMRGFYPDIWVPAGEAEELAAKLIERLQ